MQVTKEATACGRTDPSPQSEGVARTTGGADGYTPHNDLPSWEVGLTSVTRLELHLIQLSLLIIAVR